MMYMNCETTADETMTLLRKGREHIHPAFAWLFVFLPALGYFLSTRLSGVWSELGEERTAHLLVRLGEESNIACTKLAETFHLLDSCADVAKPSTESSSESSTPLPQTSMELKYPLRLVQDTGLDGVVDMLWRHDSELGRGYLLLSESSRQGRIWRWEVGGGPIAIGKTLHVDQAGCRSSLYKNCSFSSSPSAKTTSRRTTASVAADVDRVEVATNNVSDSGLVVVGSGAMAIDFYRDGNPSKHSTSEGHLMVAEWGEGRIVRLEENGARTPLVLHVPSSSSSSCTTEIPRIDTERTNECWERLPDIERMLVTPTGDLIVAANYKETDDNSHQQCDSSNSDDAAVASPFSAALILIAHVVHVKPVSTLHESRRAHAWTEVQHNITTSRILYSDPTVLRIGGISMSGSSSSITTTTFSIYMTALQLQGNGHASLVVLELPLVQDADEDDDEDEDESKGQSHRPRRPVQAKTLVDLAMYTAGSQKPGVLIVARSGRIFVAVHDGVLLVDKQIGVLGKVVVPDEPTAISLGGDGYLYIASRTQLYRIRTKEQCVTGETNLVRTPRKLIT